VIPRLLLPAALLLICLLVSCGGKRPAPSTDAHKDVSLSAAAEPVRFTDDEGREIFLDRPRSRIVSLYSAHTENLFAIGAGAQVAGVPGAADYPEEAAALPRFDYNGDPEYLIAAAPDLVLIRPFIRRQSPGYIAELERAGITVVSLYPESLDNFDGYIRRLGLLSGRTGAAEQRLADFHEGLAAIQEITANVTRKQRVFFEATANESRTVTADSLPGRAIHFAGGVNIAGDAPAITPGSSIARFGPEKLLMSADRIDVYVVQQGAMNRSADLAALRARPGFGAIAAVREGKVLFISEKLISSPTFRYLDGVRTLAAFLYPGLFK
jgi:iron complex transport system substrate-binding protein